MTYYHFGAFLAFREIYYEDINNPADFTFFVSTQNIAAQAPAKVRAEAVSLFNAKKYRQSLALLQQFGGYKPDDFEVQNMMGIAAYHANDLALAKKSLKIVLDNAKKSSA